MHWKGITMPTFLRRRSTLCGSTYAEQVDQRAAVDDGALRALVGELRFELVPMKSVEQAITDLPEAAPVSVTCSPAKGLAATQELTARLLDMGHDTVPHVSARLVEGPDHVARLARWIRDHRLRELFVVGGDAEEPVGPYADGLSFMRELFTHDTGLECVGVPSYPDGHVLIESAVLGDALLAKQSLLAEAGIAGSTTTQMCFDSERIRDWLTVERARGMSMPVDLGVPGVVDRARLMSMGVRLGIGASLRFLRKNRATMTAMLAPGGYDPTDLVADFAADAAELGIRGLHSFTFNSVADTAHWQQNILVGSDERGMLDA